MLVALGACDGEPRSGSTHAAAPPAPHAATQDRSGSGHADPPAAPPPRRPPPPLPSPTADLPAAAGRGEDFHRGISLGLFVSTDAKRWRSELYRQFLDEIAEVGATDIQLVVQWSQADLRATHIAPRPGVTAADALVRWVVAEARKRGLRVFLMPILHIEERPPGGWRGTLRPDDWDAWWASYANFTLHYARLAERSGVSLFSVGSELLSTEAQAGRWRALIARVRERFGGALTYSANWDHFEPVPFWDAVDVAGITGYQELSREDHPREDTLVAGFRGLQQRLKLWSAGTGRRYIFTEVGYPSQTHGARHPWDYRKRGEVDLQLQLRCYRALFRAFHADPALGGLFVWNWFGHGGPDDGGYTPRGKPAAEVLRHWFTGSSPMR
jgi:hypothetical protein